MFVLAQQSLQASVAVFHNLYRISQSWSAHKTESAGSRSETARVI